MTTSPFPTVKASEVARAVGGDLVGHDADVTGVCTSANLVSGSLSFVAGKKVTVAGNAHAVVIVRRGLAQADGNTYIEVERPRLAFATALSRFFERQPAPAVQSSSSVSPDAVVDRSATIGERVVIEADVTIGARTVIQHGAVICSGTRIGADCVIGPGAVIGVAGFGYERDAEGVPRHLPHVGGLRIGDDVHVGANATIARGTIVDTEIGDHTKIGPLVVVQHNVHIGVSCLIASHAVVSGSSRIDEGCWLGPNCTIRQGRHIGSHATIGLGVLVLKDVPSGGSLMGHGGIAVRRLGRFDDKPSPSREAS